MSLFKSSLESWNHAIFIFLTSIYLFFLKYVFQHNFSKIHSSTLINYLKSLVALSIFTFWGSFALVKYLFFKINYPNTSWQTLINRESYPLVRNSRLLLMILLLGLSNIESRWLQEGDLNSLLWGLAFQLVRHMKTSLTSATEGV